MCVSVSVFFPFILDLKFVGRTSRGHTGGRSHRISHPPSFCGACLNFSREKDSAIPFPRRPWSRILCTNDLIVLHPLGIFSFVFCFLVRKIPFAGIELTSQRVRGLRGTSELPGRTVHYYYHVGYCTIIHTLLMFCFCFLSGVPAWRLMYKCNSIMVGFSPILYCRPNVTTIGEPV